MNSVNHNDIFDHIYGTNPGNLLNNYEGHLESSSMVLYLSNRFTNPSMFGIILKSQPSSMIWHKFHEVIIMQTQNILL